MLVVFTQGNRAHTRDDVNSITFTLECTPKSGGEKVRFLMMSRHLSANTCWLPLWTAMLGNWSTALLYSVWIH